MHPEGGGLPRTAPGRRRSTRPTSRSQEFDAGPKAPMPRSALDGIHGTTGDDPIRAGRRVMTGRAAAVLDAGLRAGQGRPRTCGGPTSVPRRARRNRAPAAFHGREDQKPGAKRCWSGQAGCEPGGSAQRGRSVRASCRPPRPSIGPQAVDEVNRIIATSRCDWVIRWRWVWWPGSSRRGDRGW